MWLNRHVTQLASDSDIGCTASMVREPKRLPPEPDGQLIHHRTYDVEAYREDDGRRLRLRGMVHDEKPPGIYFPDDPDPLSVHQMVVDLVLDFPTLEIVEVDVVMEVTPHAACVSIEETYQKLVGLSIARGFSRKVKDLFGGPLGCTHIGALLQAMAPVAIQSIWSMRSTEEGTPVPAPLPSNPTDEQIRERFAHNLNSCHVWAEDGETIATIKRGEELEPPLWIHDRFEKLGLDIESWREKFRG